LLGEETAVDIERFVQYTPYAGL